MENARGDNFRAHNLAVLSLDIFGPFFEDGLYYVLYCGSDRHGDYPFHAGLAVSKNLFHWRKYEGNPILSRGRAGAWDEGAIWFTTVEKIAGTYYLWYEGYGGGSARTEPYVSYLKEGRSQIGLATMQAPYLYVKSEQDYGTHM